MKVVDGELVGDRDQEHYSACKLLTKAQLQAKEIEREQRITMQSGNQDSYAAWKKVFSICPIIVW